MSNPAPILLPIAPAANYKYRIAHDVGGTNGLPHTFMFIIAPDGTEYGYGFAPKVEGNLAGAGAIYNDKFHEYSIQGSEYTLFLANFLLLLRKRRNLNSSLVRLLETRSNDRLNVY